MFTLSEAHPLEISTSFLMAIHPSGPSTKDQTHMQRCQHLLICRCYFLPRLAMSHEKKNHFCQTKTKIDQFDRKMRTDGFSELHAENDADLLIVETALSIAPVDENWDCFHIIGEDTDLLVPLCHRVKDENIILRSDIKCRSSHKTRKPWNIQNMKKTLGQVLCKDIPILPRIFGGSDTTSGYLALEKQRF